MSRKLLFAALLLGGTIGSTHAFGQISAVAELYGEGVHRFNSRDYQGAEQLLNQAIENGSQDPRAFYFRGLARAGYGGTGDPDYAEAARLEATAGIGADVGRALTRIQGYERAKIEKARREARLVAQRERELQQKAIPSLPPVQVPRDPAADALSGDELRSPEVVPNPVPPTTEEIAIPETAPTDGTDDPFTDEAPSPADETVEPAADDPFGADGDAAPADDDPFAGG